MRPWLRLSSAIDRLNEAAGSWIRWLALAMVLIGAYNALARYASRYAGVSLVSNAYVDLQWYLFSLIFLLGAAYGLKRGVHVRVDVLYSRMSVRGKAWIDLAGHFAFLLPFSLLMLWVTWPAVRNSWVIRETSPDPGGLVRYPIKAVILVSFALLFLQGVSEAIKTIHTLRTGRPAPGAARDEAARAEGAAPAEATASPGPAGLAEGPAPAMDDGRGRAGGGRGGAA